MIVTDNRRKTFRKAWIFLGLLALGGAFSCPAPAQSSRDTDNRIQRLENEVQTLSRAIYRGEEPPPGAFSGGGDDAALGVRLDQLETQLRAMNGRLEEQSNDIAQLKNQIERMGGDMETRFNEMHGGGAPPSPEQYTTMGSASSQPAYDVPPPVPPAADNNTYQWSSAKGPGMDSALGTVSAATGAANDAGAQLYESAFTLLKNGQYDGAEKGFQDFLTQYPTHALASNAKYWLGESFYARGDYDRAARTFAEAYQQSPKGAKAPDNLLKLGMSLGGLGKKDDACVALGQIEKQFAATAGPVLPRAKQEMARFGC